MTTFIAGFTFLLLSQLQLIHCGDALIVLLSKTLVFYIIFELNYRILI